VKEAKVNFSRQRRPSNFNAKRGRKQTNVGFRYLKRRERGLGTEEGKGQFSQYGSKRQINPVQTTLKEKKKESGGWGTEIQDKKY